MRASNGQYAFLDTNRHIHDKFSTDFTDDGMIFRVTTHEDNSAVPSGKCAIQCARSGFENGYYLSTADNYAYLTAVSGTPSSSAYHFTFTKDTGNSYKIISLKKNYYIKNDGHLKPQSGDCGSACTFTIVHFDYIEGMV